jgi:hypothetical protein
MKPDAGGLVAREGVEVPFYGAESVRLIRVDGAASDFPGACFPPLNRYFAP